MPRLFIAIDLPPSVKESLADLCYGVRGARWSPMDQMHLTLRFIGETDDPTFLAICEELDAIDFSSFPITLKGVGHFPPRRNPRVLWVGVERTPALFNLAELIDKAVIVAGGNSAPRKFSPHVTIARFKEDRPAAEIIPFLQQNALFSTEPIAVEEFSLYSSVLTEDGANHAVEETYRLGDVSEDFDAMSD